MCQVGYMSNLILIKYGRMLNFEIPFQSLTTADELIKIQTGCKHHWTDYK